MGTRATYQFKSEHKPTVTVYVHWDGYPRGAASYFADAQAVEQSKRIKRKHFTVESFISAVEGAEITESHEVHGDTEYRYTIENGLVTVLARDMSNYNDEVWNFVCTCDIEYFIKSNQQEAA